MGCEGDDLLLPDQEALKQLRTVIQKLIEQGHLQEAFGVGTAVTVAPIKTIGYNGIDYELTDVKSRKYSLGFLDTLDKIKSGVIKDKFGWIYKV